jgi:hypothetical protein
VSTATTAVPRGPSAVMSLLERGVPLSLLMDLALGPHSAELMAVERVPGGLLSVHGQREGHGRRR